MAQITVTVRTDIGDPGTHHKFGKLIPGNKVIMEEEDFGAGLFDRPHADFLSPHEQKDKARAASEKQPVGGFEPPEEKAAPTKKGEKTATEVKDNA